MVKYFSVDWLARSHHDKALEEKEGAAIAMDGVANCKPHIPCMVQPSPPAYGKSYVQPKPKSSKPAEPMETTRCTSPISETSDYSSGYDSEAASSECLSVDEAAAGKDSAQRRVRTKFTPEQINRLLKIFNKHKYLDAGERVKTARKLGLTETQVRTWFQNRRMKLKREVQDLTPQIQPVMFQHMHPIQYHAVSGQQSHFPAPGAAFYPVVPVPPHLVLQQHMAPHPGPRVMIHSSHFY
ncbi:homeobox protein vent1-like [Syngnathus acus]|uniref:homeobox protein vent1-like n=1 Tax=Syngnathus acus TaxID=161584 RepID=UPI00188642E9|nr:homeobox protein vent1-like [Syngnathus acus]